jgi:L-2-hydroxyglutarate oxidase LhgO
MDVLVVGAGVVGLACARALALRGHSVIVAERTSGIGNGVSSRNSEVIHAGMYYPAGSVRARHCVEGRRRLYAFCDSHGVPYRRCGKLIVATNALEEAKIEGIHQQGVTNGVEDLELIDGDAARALEPNLFATAALVSPQTGIVDSHAFMLALQGDLEEAGGALAFDTGVERLTRRDGQWHATLSDDAGEIPFDAVVNARRSARRRWRGRPRAIRPSASRSWSTQRQLLRLRRRPAFTRLIYPSPVDGGLGTHVTLDLAGRMRFGPDVEWIEEEVYEVDPARAASFYASIRRYWPGLPDDALVPDYSGIRPKLTGPGEPPADFIIEGPAEHGLERHIALFGIESPGLTASLSLADEVAEKFES